MADVTIEALPDGPYLVKGPVNLVDSEGNPVELKKQLFALCRCGGSTTKPFCDGTHSRIGFQAAEAAVAAEDEA
jgi:3-phenylpropionate/trans-cinnamate dioxygenase ferredoxin subunit